MKRKIKNIVLWIAFYFNLSVFLLSICCLDSDIYWLFIITTFCSLIYLVLFYIANYNRLEKWIERKGDF